MFALGPNNTKMNSMTPIGHFRVQKPSLSKRDQVQNLSRENEFYVHDNKKSFSQERFCTWPRFKTEACGTT